MAYTTRSAIARTNQAYFAQLCETESLDWGIAYWAKAFVALGEANQFREVIVADAVQMATVFADVERYFTERNRVCQRWAPAVDFDGSALEPFLTAHGFEKVSSMSMRLEQWPKAGSSDPRVRVLPARAMRDAFRTTFLHDASVTAEFRPILAEAGVERLDNASLDMFVAMLDGQPVGRGGLFLVGDIGRVVDVAVLPAWRRKGIGRAILKHLIALAHRLAPKIVCAEVTASGPDALELFKRSGFVADGVLVEFHRGHE